MQRVTTGIAAAHDIPLVDEDGNVVSATVGTMRIIDETGAVIMAPAAIVVSSTDTMYVASSSSGHNSLAPNVVRALRVIELTLTTASGQATVVYRYAVEAAAGWLVVPDNSFQTYDQAILKSLDLSDIPNWEAATRADRVTALIEARNSLCRLVYRQVFDNEQVHLGPRFGVRDLGLLTYDEFFALDIVFRNTLALAQVAEADAILNVNSVENSREKGLIERKVGESTDVYQSTKPIKGIVSRRAMKIMAKYVVTRIRIGRTGGGSDYSDHD